MTSIVVHPEKDQLKTLKAFLTARNIPFEEHEYEKLPKHVIDGYRESQEDFAAGRYTKYTSIDDLFTK